MNVYKGDTEVKLGARTFRMRLTTHAWAYLESALHDLGRERLFDEKGMIRASAASVVAVFWACLAAPHEQAPFTRAQVAAMLDEAGGVDALGRWSDPSIVAGWANILVNAGVLDRESAELAGFIPSARKPDPKDEAGPSEAEGPGPEKVAKTAST